ncbi:MAG: MFS transporter [Candidatus Acididesulfobacter guangdongensis]|uniref:MFS transporter n=1 Tax=Acididesulfobacter guangdongensis TaxID=2597225 RepID=A0A519BFC6_ACIG2|nr:MAG: MFS transporter [Candidatus Acididesulfobacter guangdongensis]
MNGKKITITSDSDKATKSLLVAILSTIALADFGLGLNTVVLPLYAKSLGASIVTIGLIIASFGLARILINIPVSILSKKFKMQFMHVGMFMILLGAVGYYFSTFYGELFIFRFLEGFGSGIINTSSMIMLTKHLYKDEKRAKVLSKYMIARRLSMGLAPFIGAAVAFKFHFKSAFLLYAILMLIGFSISLYNRKLLKKFYNGEKAENKENKEKENESAAVIEKAGKEEKNAAKINKTNTGTMNEANAINGINKISKTNTVNEADKISKTNMVNGVNKISRDNAEANTINEVNKADKKDKKKKYINLITNISFMLLCFLTFSFFFSRIGSRRELVPLVGVGIVHINQAYIGLLVSISALIGVALTYYSDRVINKLGIKRSIVISFAISASGILWFIIFNNLDGFIASILLLSAGGGFSGPARNLYLMDSVDKVHYEEAIGIYRTLSDLGFVLGPAIIGLVFSYYNYLSAYSVVAAMLITAAILFGAFAKSY